MNRSSQYAAEGAQSTRRTNWRAVPRLLLSGRWRWATLVILAAALVMLRLGVWQLDRLAQRRAENARVEARLNEPPIALTGDPLNPAQDEYRRAVVRGTFDNEQSVLLRNRARQGAPGAHLLTPLRIEGSDQAVLVDQGWIPLDLIAPEQRQQLAVEGIVEIQGMVRAPQTRTSSLTPQDPLPENGRLDAWYRVDVARIAQQLPYPLLPFYIEAEQPADQPPGLPRPDPQIDLSQGPHLNYAIQWFAFTTILLGGYVAFAATRTRGAPPAA